MAGNTITTTLVVNEKLYTITALADTPLLWVLRDHLKLKGTKYGCGKGLCGACSIHKNGEVIRACSVSLEQSKGAKLTTIEGVDHPIKKVWIEEKVMQCGFCQAGQIMCALALLKEKKSPSEEDINNTMNNLCRCGTYPKIKSAIQKVAQL